MNMYMIPSLIISVAIAIFVYFASLGVNTWVKTQSIAKCLQGGKVETTITQGAQIQKYTQPDGAWYETCMKDMGLRNKKK